MTVKGEKADEIKEKILNFDRKLPEVSFYPKSPKVEDVNFVLKSPDENLHTRPRRCSVNPKMSRTDDQSNCSNIIEATYNKSTESHEINTKLDGYTQNVNSKIDPLTKKFKQSK